MKKASLADITYEQALGLIQMRKEAIAEGRVTPLASEKMAKDYPLCALGNGLAEKRAYNFMESLKNAWKDPAVKSTVIGGGLGALGGLGKTMTDEDDDSWGRNMLMGGVGGAALGGGLGLALNPESRDKIVNKFNEWTTSDTKPPTPGQQRAQNIQAAANEMLPDTPAAKKREQEALEATGSWAPEATTASGVAGTGGGAYLWNRWLNRGKNPADMAQYLRDNPTLFDPRKAKKGKLVTDGFDAFAKEFPDYVKGKGLSPATIGDHFRHMDSKEVAALRELFESKGLAPAWLDGRLDDKAKGILGRLHDAAKPGIRGKNVEDFGRGTGFLKTLAKGKSLRYVPKGRAAATVAAGGAAVTGLWQLWKKYLGDRSTRNDEAAALRALEGLRNPGK
jgi:hypothetical protein